MFIRCSQLSPVIGALEQNVARIEQEIRDAVSDEVDLLVLPELATSGYALTPEEARAAAWRATDPTLVRWRELLTGTGTTVALGFCEDGGDLLYNSAAVLVPDRAPIIYRKVHLWDSEKLLFAAGDHRPPVISTPMGTVGVMVCYDLEFPEFPRSVALAGADVIAVPTNWPVRNKPAGALPHEVIHAMAAAQASGIAIAICDRAGDERGTSWTAGTTVVGPDGWPVGEVDESGRLDVTVPLASDRRQISSRNHLFEDRRPDLY